MTPFTPHAAMSKSAANTSEPLTAAPSTFLFTARSTQWNYPTDVTAAQADDMATSLAAAGINLLLTEANRSLVNDWPSKPEAIDEIAQRGGAAVSERATKIVAEACHRHGIRLVHHITSTFCTKRYLDAHPEWAQVDARTGEPVFFEMYGGLWMLCPNNPEWRAFYIDQIGDFTRRTGVDGWMVDEVEFLPDWYSCGCKHCRAKFKAETGYDLPTGKRSDVWENFDSPVWRAWLRFRKRSGGDFFVDIKARLDEVAPNQILAGCVAGASETFLPQYWGMDAAELARGGNFPFYECYLGPGLPLLSWRRAIAEMRLYDALARPHGTPALTLFYPSARDEVPACWAMCNVAGNRFWALMPGTPGFSPHQVFRPEDGFFSWEELHGDAFGPQVSLAETALLFPGQTRDGQPTNDGAPLSKFATTPRIELGGRDLTAAVNEWAGWAEALTEANIPHDILRESDLTSTSGLAKYRVLAMPAALALSNAQASAVLAFVARGGKLLTAGQTGVMDETGAPRTEKDLVSALRKAATTRFDDNPGSATVRGFAGSKQLWEAERAPEARRRILDAVTSATSGQAMWSIEGAPAGAVVAGAFQQLDTKAAVVHLLNTSAAHCEVGTTAPEQGKFHPEFPPVEGLRVHLRADVAKAAAAPGKPPVVHWMPYPGTERVALKPTMAEDGSMSVELPALTQYGILRVGQ